MAERIIVGVSGASGVGMSLLLLEELKRAGCEVHLIVTEGARLTWSYECSQPIDALYELADYCWDEKDLGAPVASGSFVTGGMIILPCSMKSLAGIVTGYAENLLLRAADVCLKEGRRVVIVPREMPLGRIHLRNLLQASELGCSIVPPVLTFYNCPQTMEDQVDHVIGKILLQYGITGSRFRPWERDPAGRPVHPGFSDTSQSAERGL